MIEVFQGQPNEWKALERLCGVWDFWSYAQLLQTLKSYPYRIYYSSHAGDDFFYYEAMAIFICEPSCELLYIYTLPSKRGGGLGKKIMLGAIADLQMIENLSEILLEVRPSNGSAITLYESCGFKNYGRRARYYSNGDDALLMKFDMQRARKA